MWWLKMAEADDGTQGGAGGTPGASSDGEQAAVVETPSQPEKPPVDIAAGMLDAIEKGVGGKADELTQPTEKPVSTDDRPRDEQGRFIKTDAELRAEKPLLGPDGKPISHAAAQFPAQPAAPKKADDFALSEDDKKTLKPQSQQRFHELHKLAKEQESEVTRLTTENQALSQARDNIMSVLTESKVEPEDFVAFTDLTRRVKTGDLEGAYAIVENYRLGLLRAMGKDAPGYDPLTEHADLNARVANSELSREDALLLVKARRIEAANQQQRAAAQTGQQQYMQTERAQQGALQQVQQWNQTIARDFDYEIKARTILPQLEGIIRDYPPHLWVPTLDKLWKSITVPQQQQQLQGQQPGAPSPLRPSGAKGVPAPKSMEEAIISGLGITR